MWQKTEWMRRKTEGQMQCGSVGEVGGGYRKETESSSWPVKVPRVTSNPLISSSELLFCSNLYLSHPHLPTSVLQPARHLPPHITAASHTRVSAAGPGLHMTHPLHICAVIFLSFLSLAEHVCHNIKKQADNKRRLNAVEWWQDLQCWDGIQNLCREVQQLLCLPA